MTHIVVGCGGSGARSAHRLAMLMKEDPYWRKNMANAVFFLLVDTDAGDLEKNVRLVKDSSIEDTCVESLHVSRGFSAPYEIVEEFRAGVNAGVGKDPSSLVRFAEHWWTRHPDENSFEKAKPFMVPKLDDVTTGAGQIPMVSYLATWYSMKPNRRSTSSVEKVLEDLFKIIGDRRAPLPANDGSPLDSFNIMFLGSVAGGTGRGCSIPIAFKMKEMLWHVHGKSPTITGYFLNEDCFEKEREDYEVLPQMMNAMTGWSEISGWLTHYEHREGAGYRYSLPGITRTESGEYDVLGARKETDPPPAEKLLSRPFDTVGVICRSSGSGFSAHRDEIYDMIAVSLYTDITESQVKSKLNNRGLRYFSVGSSIIEVPYEDIEHFFISKARFDAADRVSAELIPDAQIEQEARALLEFIGFGDRALEELLKPVDDPKTVLEKLARELVAEKGVIRDRCRKMVSAMEDQDVESATKELRKLISDDALNDLARTVGGRFTSILGDKLTEQLNRPVTGIVGVVDEFIGKLIGEHEDSLLARTGSARAVAQVAQRIAVSLDGMINANGSFSDEAVAAWKTKTGRKNPLSVLEADSPRNGWLHLGKRFSPEEIEEVANSVADESLCICARALSRALATSPRGGNNVGDALGLFKVLEARLSELVASANVICAAMKDVIARKKLSADALRKKEEELFAGAQLERSIPTIVANDDTTYLLRRRVRPIMPEATSLRLECAKLQGVIRGIFGDRLDPNLDNDDLEVRVTAPIADAIGPSRYAYLRKEKDQSGAFRSVRVPILEAFTLQSVLRDISKLWPPYLSNIRSEDPDRFDRIELAFRNFFGMNLRSVEDKVSIEADDYREKGREDYLMLGMATIAARTCRPFWHARNDQGRARRVVLQVPIRLDENTKAGWLEAVGRGANLQGGNSAAGLVEVISNQASEGFNPYVLIVYANSGAESMEEITSVDAWSRNPTIRNALATAERTDTLMPFREEKEMWAGYRGSGFTDPIYILNNELASSRWRPWFEKLVDADIEKGDLMMALAYAWLGPEWFLRKRLLESEFGPLGNKTIGSMFKFGPHASICIARRPGYFDKGYSTKSPLEFPWKRSPKFGEMPEKDLQISENLDGLLEAFDPEGDNASLAFRVFRQEMVNEYRTFLREIGDLAGFDPVHHRVGYGKILQELGAYVEDRLGGRLTDPEHPATSGRLISDDDVAEGSLSSKKFWKALAEAIGEAGAK
jgi:hypothetical protein